MKKYEELRRLTPDSVRTLCIRKMWYTRGDSEAYADLLNKVWEIEDSEESITADQLGEIAEDIKAHSNTEYEVESIMWELNRAANTSFCRARS